MKEGAADHPFGISRVCRIIRISRSSLSYRSLKEDVSIEQHLLAHAQRHPREGFWKAYFRIRNTGIVINHKRVHRVYKQLGLALRRKVKKRLPARRKETLVQPALMHDTWSIDFVSDALTNGRKFRSFNIIDDYNREVLFIETDYSIKSSRVLWVLNHLVHKNRAPKKIRMDNGPEFIARIATQWSMVHGIEFKYTQPGKPTQNAYIERFNRTYRQDVLDSYLFESIEEVREINEQWMLDYNHYRPHDALDGMSPIMWKCGQQGSPPPGTFLTTLPHDNNNSKLEKSTAKSTFEQY